MRRRWGSLLLAGLLLAAPALVWGQDGTISQSLTETFTGRPASPTAYHPPGWDVQIHSRDSTAWETLEPMAVQHGPACEPPLATHAHTGAYPTSVFQCSDHLMTAISAGGYAVIYLTPPALLDWTNGEAVVRWDMSTFRTSYRDWVDLWLSPMEDHLALPLDRWLPDLAGEPRHAVHIRMDNNIFRPEIFRDFVQEEPASQWWIGYDTFLTPDAARRDTFELRMTRTHVKFGMPGYNFWWIDTDIADLGWSQAVVQLGHHDYNPSKDCEYQGLPTCSANTWHWDNVSLSPAVPFTITPLSPRRLGSHQPDAANVWTLPSPAPAGAMLRYAGVGTDPGTQRAAMTLSYDEGATWQPVAPQPAPPEIRQDGNSDHTRSYWLPLPAGTTSVRVRSDGDWYSRIWQAKDASMWTFDGGPVATPTPLPSLPPSPSAVPPTRTLEPTATVPPSTLTPLPATPTPALTATPVATATRTPLPGLPPGISLTGGCQVAIYDNAVYRETRACHPSQRN